MDAGVEIGVAEIDEEIDGDVGDGGDEDDALDEGEVFGEDGGDGEAADPLAGEDGFDDDGAAEEEAELQTDDGDDGDHGVPEGVPGDHHAFPESLGAGGQDVVLAEDFEQVGADEASGDGGEIETE